MRAFRQLPWWWWIASCGLTPAYATTPFSTTSWSISDALFGEAVAVYFEQAVVCKQQRKAPTPGLMRNEVLGFIAAQERWWPGRIEYRDRLFAVMLSEGHGLPGGNPTDPSYGVMHVTYLAARHAATFWRIESPKRERDFIKRLQEDSRFCIQIAAGVLALLESGFGGDWLRAVGGYKCGMKGWADLVAKYPDRPITDLDVIRGPIEKQRMFECVTMYAQMGTRLKDCQCLVGTP